MFNLPIEQAKLLIPVYLYKKTLSSLWINRFTYKFRLVCVAVALKYYGERVLTDTDDSEAI